MTAVDWLLVSALIAIVVLPFVIVALARNAQQELQELGTAADDLKASLLKAYEPLLRRITRLGKLHD